MHRLQEQHADAMQASEVLFGVVGGRGAKHIG